MSLQMIYNMARVEYIDRLKGFAILCVVVGHFTLWAYGMNNDPMHDFVYLFHMPLFIFLSGIVIGSAPKLSKVLVKAFQFLCPFFIVGLTYTAFIKGNFHDFITGHYKYGYWYLMVLTISYFLLLPFQISNNKRNGTYIAIDIILALCIYFILNLVIRILPLNIVDTLGLGLVCAYWPYFILGYITRKYTLTKWLMSHNIIMSLAMIIIIPASIMYFSSHGHMYNLIALAFIVILMYLFKQREERTSIIEQELSRFGKGSLNIYIFHYFVINYINLSTVGDWLVSSGNLLISALLNISISIIVAYIAYGFGHLIQQSELIKGIVYGNYIKRLIKVQK